MKIRFTLGTNTDGESIKLPVIPPSFNENFTDKIEYYTSINGLEHSIYKPAGARNLTFESYFPFTSSDPLATGSSWEEPMFYVNFFLRFISRIYLTNSLFCFLHLYFFFLFKLVVDIFSFFNFM